MTYKTFVNRGFGDKRSGAITASGKGNKAHGVGTFERFQGDPPKSTPYTTTRGERSARLGMTERGSVPCCGRRHAA